MATEEVIEELGGTDGTDHTAQGSAAAGHLDGIRQRAAEIFEYASSCIDEALSNPTSAKTVSSGGLRW